jgi:hypothetical protein
MPATAAAVLIIAEAICNFLFVSKLFFAICSFLASKLWF